MELGFRKKPQTCHTSAFDGPPMSTVASAEKLAPLAQQLRRLRGRLNRWLLVDGLRRLALWLLGLIAFDFVLDWLFVMDRPQRFVMLLLAGALLVAVFLRRLVVPLLRRPSDDALCLQVDRRHGLGDSLISALQLARVSDVGSRGISPAMVNATIARGVATTNDVRFETVLDRSGHRRNLVWLLAATAVLLGFFGGVALTETLAVWFDRNILLADRSWPQDTYLAIANTQDGQLRVPRGADWRISVRVEETSRRLPDEVTLQVKADRRVRYEAMEGSSDRRRFDVLLKRISGPLELRASSGRAVTPWVQVRPIDYPALADLSLEIIAPPFAGGERQILMPDKAHKPIVAGSRLAVRGRASKRLTSARLMKLNSPGQPEPSVAVNLAVKKDSGFSGELPLNLDSSGSYAIELADDEQIVRPGSPQAENLVNRDAAKFSLRVQPDRAPKVKLRRGRIGRMVVADARVPVAVNIDEQFGLTDVRLIRRWEVPAEEDAAEGSIESQSVSRADLAEQWSDNGLAFRETIELADLELPIGTQLQIVVEADDNNDMSGPNTGTSSPLRFRVVSREELRTDLLHRENVLREAVRGQQKKQVAVLADTQELLQRVEGPRPPDDRQLSQLARLQKEQKLVGANLIAMTERLTQILAEIRYNQLDAAGGDHYERLSKRVIEPLQALTATESPQAVRHLDRARRLWHEQQQVKKALTEATAQQIKIDQQLAWIVDAMVQDVDFQLVLDLLREIEGSQANILKKTEEERLRIIRQLLEEEGQNGNSKQEQNE
jgi:hypothetical protein